MFESDILLRLSWNSFSAHEIYLVFLLDSFACWVIIFVVICQKRQVIMSFILKVLTANPSHMIITVGGRKKH